MKVKKLFNHKTTIFLSLFLFAFCFFLVSFFSKDPDYYWHMRAGKYMVENHTILTHDVFSWIANGRYWMSHEWLFEVIFYRLFLLFSHSHMILYVLVCFLCLQFTLYFTNKVQYEKNIPFTLLWIIFSLILYGMVQARPYMISFILLSLVLYLLFDLYRNENSKKVYFLPVLSILWSNIHGGSSNLPYIFILIFLISGFFSFSFSKIEAKRYSKKQLKKYGILFILCIIATIMNPHGLRMILYPYQNMADQMMIDNILEWKPTDLGEIGHYPYLFLSLFTLCIFLFSKKKIRLLDFILFLSMLFLGLKSIRFWPYLYLSMSYVIFYYIPKRKLDHGTYFTLGALACLCMVSFSFNLSKLNKEIHSQMLDDKLMKTIKKENPKRLYNFYDYGGYLVFHDIPVFVDGRADLYSSYNFSDYLNLCYLRGNYKELLDFYSFDYFLVSDQYPIKKYLDYEDEYEEIMHSGDTYFYKKKTSE